MADVYKERSYAQVPIGFGQKPGIVVVDYQVGFTDSQYPLGGAPLVMRGVENTQRLLEKARKCGVPVANCYTAYHNEDEMPYWKVRAVRETFIHGHPMHGAGPAHLRPGPRHQDLQERRVHLLRHHGRLVLRQAARGHRHRHRLRDQRLHPRHGERQLQPPFPHHRPRGLRGRPRRGAAPGQPARHVPALCRRLRRRHVHRVRRGLAPPQRRLNRPCHGPFARAATGDDPGHRDDAGGDGRPARANRPAAPRPHRYPSGAGACTALPGPPGRRAGPAGKHAGQASSASARRRAMRLKSTSVPGAPTSSAPTGSRLPSAPTFTVTTGPPSAVQGAM